MLNLNADQILTASNLTISVWLLVLAVVSFRYFTRHKELTSDIRLILFGVGVEALGWSLHRAYWGTVRHIKDRYGDSTYIVFADSWIPQAILLAMIIGGITLILTPLWKMMFKRHWKWLPTFLVTGTFAFFTSLVWAYSMTL